eukprot:GHVU01161454.1.p2 GENE.GHVU01161454.1~~GHVU01161454.1.p2  ORF type:complete len:340 (-),score=11.00 GHVU01161454.1:606-1625(-)
MTAIEGLVSLASGTQVAEVGVGLSPQPTDCCGGRMACRKGGGDAGAEGGTYGSGAETSRGVAVVDKLSTADTTSTAASDFADTDNYVLAGRGSAGDTGVGLPAGAGRRLARGGYGDLAPCGGAGVPAGAGTGVPTGSGTGSARGGATPSAASACSGLASGRNSDFMTGGASQVRHDASRGSPGDGSSRPSDADSGFALRRSSGLHADAHTGVQAGAGFRPAAAAGSGLPAGAGIRSPACGGTGLAAGDSSGSGLAAAAGTELAAGDGSGLSGASPSPVPTSTGLPAGAESGFAPVGGSGITPKPPGHGGNPPASSVAHTNAVAVAPAVEPTRVGEHVGE